MTLTGPPSTDLLNLLVVVGPTAVGKTSLAIELAQRVAGEIVSADSRYLYRGMDIGTAKPTLTDRVRVPHYLIDVTDPDQPWTLAQYRDAATTAINDINRRGHLPMLVGGTGQYVHALIEGWAIPKRAADLTLRTELQAIAEREGVGNLYERLRVADPEAAARIDPRNVRRVVRALEVTLASGQRFSLQRRKTPPPYRFLTVGLTLPRPKLYQRIDERVESMLASGLVAETESLVAKGYEWSLPAVSAIGYKQIGMYLRGEIDFAEAERLIKRETRRLVRRQANWFRKDDPDIRWYDTDTLDVDQLATEVKTFFEKT